jgi:hypothetical protein
MTQEWIESYDVDAYLAAVCTCDPNRANDIQHEHNCPKVADFRLSRPRMA